MKTYEEIREELEKEIDELYAKDPSWKKCSACPLKGKCCHDNDIDIREDEWELIKAFLDSHPDISAQVKENFDHKKKCYFQTEKCCLLGELRPLNCLYTPYQLIQNKYTGRVTYSSSDDACEFEEISEIMDFYNENEYLVYLPEEKRHYLLLTYWMNHYYLDSEKKESRLGEHYLKNYFNGK